MMYIGEGNHDGVANNNDMDIWTSGQLRNRLLFVRDDNDDHDDDNNDGNQDDNNDDNSERWAVTKLVR